MEVENENRMHSRRINDCKALSRRKLVKALAGFPFLGGFVYSLNKEISHDNQNSSLLKKQFGLDKVPEKSSHIFIKNKELLRVGIIGYGSRAVSLAKGLGYRHTDDIKRRSQKSIDLWLQQEDLNIALTGICDVFDIRAKKGMETATNELRPSGAEPHGLPVKQYPHYHEMLNDKDIDAVIIATPDHWHAQMILDAVSAGKHVYCEKSITRTEQELYRVYDAVKNSNIVFQLGHQITQNQVFQQAKALVNRDALGHIALVDATTNRNTSHGAWIRHLDAKGNALPGNTRQIKWDDWLGSAERVPFSVDRYYNWTKWFDYGTGMLGQLFSHEYDAINQLLEIGIPRTVVSSGGIYYWKDNREIPDVLHSTFEYPERNLTVTYSGNLASSYQRGRIFMGHDATMELGASVKLKADKDTTKYKNLIEDGIINTSEPMLDLNPFTAGVDAVSSATAQYYASRGLTYTYMDNKKIDVTHLHIKEWLDCIRHGGTPSANIERAFEEGVTLQMAHKAYLEKRMVKWDPEKKRII